MTGSYLSGYDWRIRVNTEDFLHADIIFHVIASHLKPRVDTIIVAIHDDEASSCFAIYHAKLVPVKLADMQ